MVGKWETFANGPRKLKGRIEITYSIREEYSIYVPYEKREGIQAGNFDHNNSLGSTYFHLLKFANNCFTFIPRKKKFIRNRDHSVLMGQLCMMTT